MKNIKKIILNISLALMLIATFVFGVWLYLDLEKSFKMAESSMEYFLIAIVARGSIVLIAVLILVEISAYFNLRYLILCKEKILLNTAFNLSMLISTLLFFFSCMPLEIKFIEIFAIVFLVLIAVLRIIYALVKRKKALKAEVTQ